MTPLWALIAVALAARTQANSNKGDSADDFAALCQAIRLAATPATDLAVADDGQAAAAAIAAINITVADDNFTTDIDETKTWATAEITYKNKHPGRDAYHDAWAEAKRTIKADSSQTYCQWQKFKQSKAAQKQIQQIAQEAFDLKQEIEQKKKLLTPDEVNKHLAAALQGPTGQTKPGTTLNFGARWAERGQICTGNAGTDEQLKAGTSLILDSLCLCAMGTDDTDAGQACCAECADTKTADQVGAGAHLNFDAKWTKLLAHCTSTAPQHQLATGNVAKVIALIAGKLKHKAGAQVTVDNYLGKIDGSGTTGCKGNTSGNEGKCVAYKKGIQTTGPDAVQWARELHTAGQKQEARLNAEQDITRKAAQLRSLNQTLGWLFLALMDSTTAADPQNPKPTPLSPNSSGTSAETAKECSKLGSNTSCKANDKCKWEEIDGKGQCKVDESKS